MRKSFRQRFMKTLIERDDNEQMTAVNVKKDKMFSCLSKILMYSIVLNFFNTIHVK